MDKKLLDALNNLSIGLEILSQALEDNGKEMKSAVSQALKSIDLDKKFKTLSKGIESLADVSKKITDGQNTTLKILEEQSKKIAGLSKSTTGAKAKITKVNQGPELAPLPEQEIPLKYGEVPTLPELGKIEEQIIPIKYGELPTLPELGKIKEQIIPLKYGKAPIFVNLSKIKETLIPLKYGKVPIFINLEKIKEAIIPLKYGSVPTLPKMAKIEEQIIPLKYGDIPTLPEMAKVEEQIIPLVYGELPTLPSIAEQVIQLKYGELPSLPSIGEQIIPLKYGEVPTLPKMGEIEEQIIPLKYGEVPTLRDLAKVEDQIIPLKYGEVPTLPEMAKIIEQIIPLKYGEVPTLPEMAKISEQIIPLKYGEVPTLPEMAKVEEQIIPLKYGEVPTLPEMAKIGDQIIPLKYGDVPTLPKMGEIEEQIIPLKYGEVPTLPKMGEIEEQIIPLKYGEVPTLPEMAKIGDQIIPLKYGDVPTLPEMAKIGEQVIPLKYGEAPTLPEMAKISEQIIPLKYGDVPTLPEMAKIGDQIIPLKYGDVPTLPEMAKISEQIIPLKYGELPTLPEMAKVEEQIIPLKCGEAPTLPEMAKIGEQVIPLKYGEAPTLPEMAKVEEQIIPLKYGDVPTLPEMVKISQQIIPLKYGELPTLPEMAKISEQIIPLKYGEVPTLPEMAKVEEQIIPLKYGELPTLPEMAKIGDQIIPLKYGDVPTLPELGKIDSQEIPLSYGKLPELPKVGKVDSIELPVKYGKMPDLPKMAKMKPIELPVKWGKIPKLPQLPKISAQEIALKYEKVKPFTPPTPKKVIIPTEYEQPKNKVTAPPKQTVKGQAESPMDPKKNKGIKEGIGLILLMAVAIVALGLAFKVIGGVNIGTVLALSVAIPILALAFAKVSEYKSLTLKRALELTGVMVAIATAVLLSSFILSAVAPVGGAQILTTLSIALMFTVIGFGLQQLINSVQGLGPKAMRNVFLLPIIMPALSLAILLSSFILSMVQPVGMVQLFSAIAIAGVFYVLSLGIEKLVEGVSKIGAGSLVALAIMPLVLAALSFSIMLSSYFLSAVAPVGIVQLFTAIGIAAVFTVLSYGLKNLMEGISSVGIKSLLFLPFLPLIMVTLSLAIAMSSYVLGAVKPVGILQLFTAILIAGVFSVLAYGLNKMISALKGVNPATAAVIAVALPILLVAISFAIMASSYAFAAIKPIGLTQFLTALAISIIFIPISFALPYISKAIQNISIGRIVLLPVIMVAMAVAIWLSSEIFAKVTPIPLATLFNVVMIAITMALVTLILGFTAKLINSISIKTFLKGALAMVIIATTIMTTSLILAKGEYTKYPSIGWLIGSLLGVAGFGIVMFLLDKVGLNPAKVITGAIAIVAIAGAIYVSSLILSKGNYTKYPTIDWAIGVAASMIPFGIASVILGAIATSGVGALAIAAGLVAIIAIAGTIIAVDKILSIGSYGKYPTLPWVKGVGASLLAFGVATVGLGTFIVGTIGIGALALAAGKDAVLGIAQNIVDAAEILSKGNFTGGPKKEWAEGVAIALGAFSPIYSMLAKGGIMKLFTGGPSPQEFGQAIVAICDSINIAAERLSKGKFIGGPTKAWSEGVGLGIGAFASVYKMLLANSIMKMFGGGGIGPKDFASAIQAISAGLLVAGESLSKGTFTGGPTKEWSEGVAAGIGGFSQVYNMLMANAIMKMFGGGGIGPKDFGKAIQAISQGLLISSEILAKGTFTGGPTKKWSEGVAAGIGGFSQVYSMLMSNAIMKMFGGGGIGPKDFSKAVEAISKGLMVASLNLAKGNFTGGPSKNWAEGVSASIGAFSKVYNMLISSSIMKMFGGGGISPQDFGKAIESISKGLTKAGDILSKGKFTGGPSVSWALGVREGIGAFSSVYAMLISSGIPKMFGGGFGPKDFATAIETMSEALKKSGNILSKGKFSGGPTLAWAMGVSQAIGGFSKVYDMMVMNKVASMFGGGGLGPIEFAKAVESVSKSLNLAGELLSGGKFTGGPTEAWAKGVSLGIGGFGKVYGMLLANQIAKMFGGGGIGPEQFAEAVKSVSIALTIAGSILSTAKFTGGPTEEWSKGVAAGIGGFSTVYKMLLLNRIAEMFGGGGIGPDQFSEAVKTVSTALAVAGIILGPAKFTGGPTEEWSKGVAAGIGGFSTVYKMLLLNRIAEMFGGGGIGPTDFSKAVESVSMALMVAGRALENGKFTGGPTVAWSEGVGKALGAFSAVYRMMAVNGLAKMFGGGGLGPNEFASAIEVVSGGLVKAGEALAGGKFIGGPTLAWSEGVSKALGAFSPIYTMLAKNKEWISAGPSIEEYKTAIRTVALGMVEAAKILASPEAQVAYKNGPSKQWAEGVSIALQGFTGIFSSLNKDSSWFSGGQDYEFYGKAIESVGRGLVAAARAIGAEGVTYDLNKVPKPEWGKNVGEAFKAFIPALKLVQSAGSSLPWGQTGAEVVLEAMTAIGDSLVNVSLTISKGNFKTIIPLPWVTGLKDSFGMMVDILKRVNGEKFTEADSWGPLGNIASAVKIVSQLLVKGIYPENLIPDEWTSSVTSTFNQFISIMKDLGKMTDFTGIRNITNNVVWVSKILSRGKYDYQVNEDWLDSTKTTFDNFIEILKSVRDLIPMDYVKFRAVGSNLVWISNLLPKGKYDFIVPEIWTDSTVSTMQTFAELFSSMGRVEPAAYQGIRNMVNNIVWTSLILPRGKYDYSIPKTFSMNLESIFNDFIKLSSISEKLQPKSVASVRIMSRLVTDTSLNLKRGFFNTMIPKGWAQSIQETFKQFALGISFLKKEDVLKSLDKTMSKQLMELSQCIIDVANFFNKTKTNFDPRRMPSLAWSQGFSQIISAIIPGLQFMEENDSIFGLGDSGADKLKKGVQALANAVVDASNILSKGKFTVRIPTDYFTNLSASIQSYIEITKNLNGSGSTSSELLRYVDGMTKLAEAYDKLSRALNKLNSEVNKIDKEKMDTLKNMAGSVVLLSLMDSSQFDKMMMSLESKAKMFVEFFDKTAKQSLKEAPGYPTAEVEEGAKKLGPQSTAVKPTAVKKEKKPEDLMSEMSGYLKLMATSLASIQGVIGESQKDITLSGYLSYKQSQGQVFKLGGN